MLHLFIVLLYILNVFHSFESPDLPMHTISQCSNGPNKFVMIWIVINDIVTRRSSWLVQTPYEHHIRTTIHTHTTDRVSWHSTISESNNRRQNGIVYKRMSLQCTFIDRILNSKNVEKPIVKIVPPNKHQKSPE